MYGYIYNGARYGKGNFSPHVPVDISRYPTVIAERPSSNVSPRYSFIPTTRPLQVLADYGWFPVAVQEATTRTEEKQGFQRHLVRLANHQWNKEMEVGGTIPQILLTNDHSGAAAFEFLVGLYEKVCANQLCISRGDFGGARVLHKGYTDELVESSIRSIVETLPEALSRVDEYKGITLSRDQQLGYAASAIELRWDGDAYAVKPDEVLLTRHHGQQSPTLWNTYNRTQEALLRGGVRQVNAEGRRSRAKAVKSVKEDLRLNKALWTLTQKMAALVR